MTNKLTRGVTYLLLGAALLNPINSADAQQRHQTKYNQKAEVDLKELAFELDGNKINGLEIKLDKTGDYSFQFIINRGEYPIFAEVNKFGEVLGGYTGRDEIYTSKVSTGKGLEMFFKQMITRDLKTTNEKVGHMLYKDNVEQKNTKPWF